MQALVRELDGALGDRRPRVAVVALQDDKPVEAMLGSLAPALDALVATTSGHAGHARALPAEALAAAARTAGFARRRGRARPGRRHSRVRVSARAREARSSSPDRSTCSSVCVPRALEAS